MQSDTAADNETPIFEALLVPYRSLGRRGYNFMMLGLGTLSLFAGLAFLSQGAWPVVGFFGLDVLVLWIAFRASYRSAAAREEVRVSRTQLTIRKIAPNGRAVEASYNPFWTRLLVRRHAEIGVTGMAVAGNGRQTEIGAFLNPADRESFATAFGHALSTAKRG